MGKRTEFLDKKFPLSLKETGLLVFLLLASVIVLNVLFFKPKVQRAMTGLEISHSEKNSVVRKTTLTSSLNAKVQHQQTVQTHANQMQRTRAGAASRMEIEVNSAPQKEEEVYREQKLVEFLQKKVGLTEEQVELVQKKDKRFYNDIRIVDYLIARRHPNSQKLRKLMIENHQNWMSVIMGEDNYHQYLLIQHRS